MRWFIVVVLGVCSGVVLGNSRLSDLSKIPWNMTAEYWTLLGDDALEYQMEGELLLPEWNSPKVGYWLLYATTDHWSTTHRAVFAYPQRSLGTWVWRWVELPRMARRLHGHLSSRALHQEGDNYRALLCYLSLDLEHDHWHVPTGMCSIQRVDFYKEARAEGFFEIITGGQHSRKRVMVQMSMDEVRNDKLTFSRRCVLWLTGG